MTCENCTRLRETLDLYAERAGTADRRALLAELVSVHRTNAWLNAEVLELRRR